jgi:hypothetical protein
LAGTQVVVLGKEAMRHEHLMVERRKKLSDVKSYRVFNSTMGQNNFGVE